MNTFKRIALAVLAAPLFLIAPAHAAGPLAKCGDGVPFLWPNGGQNIVWNADLGGLGDLTKAEADTFVAQLLRPVAERPQRDDQLRPGRQPARSTSTKPTSWPFLEADCAGRSVRHRL